MDDFERQRLKDVARETWWRSWEEEDFSWDALGALVGGQPRWPWNGVYVEEDGLIAYEGNQSKNARRATVQDYWATNFETMKIREKNDLIESRIIIKIDNKYKHFLNVKGFRPNKSSDVYKLYKSELQIREKLSFANSRAVKNNKHVGFDGRIQLVGATSSFLHVLSHAPFINAINSEISYLIFNDADSVDLGFLNCIINIIHSASTTSSGIRISSSYLMEDLRILSATESLNLNLSNSKIFKMIDIQNCNGCEIIVHNSEFYRDFWVVRSRFSSKFHLTSSRVHGHVFMEEAHALGKIDMSYSKFFSSFQMEGAKVEGDIVARGTEFGGDFSVGPARQINGDSATSKFNGRIDFSDAKFNSRAGFDDAFFPEEKSCRGGFRRVQFKSNVSWSKDALHAVSIFASARIEGTLSLPWLNELSERKLLREKTLREAQRNGEDAIQAVIEGAQTLKKALLQQGDFLRAQLYHKLELQAKAVSNGTPCGERLAGRAYGALSDWGLSWHLPLLWLIAGGILFAGIYNWLILLALGNQFGPVTFGFDLPVHSAIAAGIELSMSNALGPIKYLIGNDGPPALSSAEIPFAARFWLGLLSILQQIGSLALLFLSALALRRRFQIG
ncbi:hypothetical protein [Glycocaulis sp.]|uniref:hypothetical protein n=1 Tax=Glycocaulis sp. TaxID=1969725 RepID=UPI003F6EF69F